MKDITDFLFKLAVVICLTGIFAYNAVYFSNNDQRIENLQQRLNQLEGKGL